MVLKGEPDQRYIMRAREARQPYRTRQIISVWRCPLCLKGSRIAGDIRKHIENDHPAGG